MASAHTYGHMKRWIYRPEVEGALPPSASLAERLGISDLLLRLLLRRGLSSVQDMDVYLSPQLRHLAPLEEWPGLAEAAGVITAGITAGMPFAVWGDYDVDGVTSTALVHDVLEFHGVDVRHHLPDRRAEGYGLNVEWIERLAADGVRLLLTVDCGISDVVPISRARELGMTVVVSDHHLPPEVLPPAHAICNPRLACCPCPALAGVGVAFFVMAAVNAALGERSGRRYDMREVLDLVALGTLADVVDLGGQNRILVKNGLLKIAEARRPGMAALKAVAGYNPSASLGAGQVVFGLAPRINAAGRLGEAEMALQLLRARNHGEAAQLAQRLDAMNTDRRVEEDRILEEAKRQAESQAASRMGFVLHGEDWHPGVIGIVASRIVEAYYRPTLILCTEGETLKGSGRSVSEFDLHAGLSQCADLFLGFGGHRQAAGMSLKTSALDALRERFDTVVRQALGDTPLTASLKLDGDLGFEHASDFTVLKELEMLQPFGTGNAEPVFASPPLLVRGLRRFGKAREHVELELTDESCGVTLHAKAWRQSGEFSDRLRGTRIRLAYTPRIDRYSGAASVDLRIRDWQPA
ncbi:exonuclease RecJ [Nitratidesulfovibrio vulgaris DP4]|uniref:Single-stranded-DNA-specific exonuclease RecJ n=2 Tax=Nitratidesulfovibrio vulgaris TaxID=881 RepID=A0A0H3A8Z3_NITV4|nr:exonuclease RecJ [Nitratidesulfovibrio vulgaris DP4]